MEPSQASRALQVILHTAMPLLRSKLTSLEDAASPPASPTTTAATNLAYGSAGEVQHTLLASALPSSPRLSSAFDSASDLAEVLMSPQVMPVPADTLALPPDDSGRSHPGTTPMLSPAPSSPLPRNGNGHSHSNGNGHSHAPGSDPMCPPAMQAHSPAAGESRHDSVSSPGSVLKEWVLSWAPPCSIGLASSTYSSLSRAYRRVCGSVALARAAQWLPIASQLHLALFYVFGLYYEVPKRLSGVQYAHIGASTTQRRYFGAMGVLLLVQVLVNARWLIRCASCAALAGGSWPAWFMLASVLMKAQSPIRSLPFPEMAYMMLVSGRLCGAFQVEVRSGAHGATSACMQERRTRRTR